MFGLIAALAAAAQEPAAPSPYEADLRCMLSISVVLGAGDEQDPESPEALSLTALMMYYVGKIDAQAPDLDYVAEIAKLLQAPNYSETQLSGDLLRCAAEVEARGKSLESIGKELIRLAPLLDAKHS